MITDRGLSFLIFAMALMALAWVFSVTRAESGLLQQRMLWFRRLAFCCLIVACIPLIQSFIPKAPVNLQLFESKTCRIACWNDLVIGQTNLDSVRAFLKMRSGKFEEKNTDELTGKKSTKSFVTETADGMQIQIDTVDDFINKINLFANPFSLSVNTIITNLGSTKYVLIIYNIVPGEKVTIWSEVMSFYPDKGYVISTNLASNVLDNQVESCISGNEFVNNITIVEPGSIDQVLMRLANSSDPNDVYSVDRARKYILNGLKPLPTFGCFKMPYPPISDLLMQSW